jgi:hypothetical protein
MTNVDLGYRLRRSTWNMGYATERTVAYLGKPVRNREVPAGWLLSYS